MKQVLTDNLTRYCSETKLNSVSLGELTGISQRTSHRLLSSKVEERNPTIASIEAVSEGLKIPYWQLFLPDLPTELMGSKDMEQLVILFAGCSNRGREKIIQNIKDITRLDELDRGK